MEDKKVEEKEQTEEIKIVKPITISNQRMEMSKNIGSIAGALAKAQGEIGKLGKEKAGYGYRYADLGSVITISKKALSENGLSFVQGHILVKGSNPTMLVETMLMHESGEWIKTEMEGVITPMKQLSAIQSQAVSITYCRRYALQSILGIAAEEDTDGTAKK